MKLKADTRFPYPVLSSFTNDYPSADFDFDIESVIEAPATGEVEIRGKIRFGEKFLDEAIIEEKISCALYITCEATYFSEFIPIRSGGWKASVSGGNLRGAVKVRAIVYVVSERFVLPSYSIHEEFGPQDFYLDKNALVGASDEFEFEAGFDKLIPMESVFRLESEAGVEDGRFLIGSDTQAIVIRVNPELYRSLNEVRNSSQGREILLSSLYLPCLMEVLDLASQEKAEHLRWYRAVESRCREVGEELDGRDLLRKAQKLLNFPVGKVRKAIEGLGS